MQEIALMATDTKAPGGQGSVLKNSRGKDQIHWPEGVWEALDAATTHELMRSRVAGKFLPQVYVHKKETTVPADIVIIPPAPPAGGQPDALSIDEGMTVRMDELGVLTKLTVAQMEAEAHQGAAAGAHDGEAHHPGSTATAAPTLTAEHHEGGHSPEHRQHHTPPVRHHYASTGVSLSMQAANRLALAEDLYIFNGSNAVANAPLFINKTVQILDPNVLSNLGMGMLNISQGGAINPKLDPRQIIKVSPINPIAGYVAPAGGPPVGPPFFYRENTLNAVASGISVLQGFGHYEHYALVLQTYPYADLHQALPTTLIEPVEPISHLVKAGVYGTSALPPFDGNVAGLPVTDQGGNRLNGVQYTGVLVSLAGNTMDLVRGRMENHLDAVVAFSQKDPGEQYRFRTSMRLSYRLKDLTAVILLLFMNQ
jgi:uncharacterized linocin/CFP29 family protein